MSVNISLVGHHTDDPLITFEFSHHLTSSDGLPLGKETNIELVEYQLKK